MISTTIYKWEYTGNVQPWGRGWYNPDDKGVVTLIDPYFYMKEGFSIVGITTDNNTISISVNFISEQMLNNDEGSIVKNKDTWTFEKPVNSSSPIWILTQT